MELPPDRLGPLIGQLEAGRPVTREDVRRVAALQALDMARAGRQFVLEALAADAQLAKDLEAVT